MSLTKRLVFGNGVDVKQFGITSDSELTQVARELNIPMFNGVIMKDELPGVASDGWWIVNLQSSFQGTGTHWVFVCRCPRNQNVIYYFDSYGQDAPEQVHAFAQPYELIENRTMYQSFHSTMCGWFCLFIAYHMFYLNQSFFVACNHLLLNNQDQNDVLIKDFFTSLLLKIK